MPGLGPRLSGSVIPTHREMPAPTYAMMSLALPGQGITDAAPHPIVMPGLGPGIHELLGAARAKAQECRDKYGFSRPAAQDELVDARAKPWHDGGGWRRLRAKPDSRGLGPGMTRECAAVQLIPCRGSACAPDRCSDQMPRGQLVLEIGIV